jgi:hypothetical protein
MPESYIKAVVIILVLDSFVLRIEKIQAKKEQKA